MEVLAREDGTLNREKLDMPGGQLIAYIFLTTLDVWSIIASLFVCLYLWMAKNALQLILRFFDSLESFKEAMTTKGSESSSQLPKDDASTQTPPREASTSSRIVTPPGIELVDMSRPSENIETDSDATDESPKSVQILETGESLYEHALLTAPKTEGSEQKPKCLEHALLDIPKDSMEASGRESMDLPDPKYTVKTVHLGGESLTESYLVEAMKESIKAPEQSFEKDFSYRTFELPKMKVETDRQNDFDRRGDMVEQQAAEKSCPVSDKQESDSSNENGSKKSKHGSGRKAN